MCGNKRGRQAGLVFPKNRNGIKVDIFHLLKDSLSGFLCFCDSKLMCASETFLQSCGLCSSRGAFITAESALRLHQKMQPQRKTREVKNHCDTTASCCCIVCMHLTHAEACHPHWVAQRIAAVSNLLLLQTKADSRLSLPSPISSQGAASGNGDPSSKDESSPCASDLRGNWWLRTRPRASQDLGPSN